MGEIGKFKVIYLSNLKKLFIIKWTIIWDGGSYLSYKLFFVMHSTLRKGKMLYKWSKYYNASSSLNRSNTKES